VLHRPQEGKVTIDLKGAIIKRTSIQCVAEPECLLFIIIREPDNCKRTYQIFDRIEQLNIDLSVKRKKTAFFLIREAKSGKRELHWRYQVMGIAGV
jgi:hypothetical protein